MLKPNFNYQNLKDSYLFFGIAQKVNAYKSAHPEKEILRLGIGDVTRPLPPAVIAALHEAAEDQAKKESFHGYMPECGDPVLREAIREHYQTRGVSLLQSEVFVSSGASDELGDILDLFDRETSVLIMEPAYPAYADANVMAGHPIRFLKAGKENGFLPLPREDFAADLIYLCSPNNPTGAVYDREGLKQWVDFANRHGSVILFDAAYEAYIEDPALPHSIFEIEGARDCAIEISSLSKTAGFTGTRCGYTVIPESLSRAGMNFNAMWVRNRTTKTNGVSYIIQKAARAVFTPEGLKQIRETLSVYKENARVLTGALEEAGVWYCGGKNAPYVWMQCPGNDSWAFFDRLLNEKQIVATPGAGFGEAGEGYMRFSTFAAPEDIKIAADRLKELLRAY